jgi:two-component sensor histidine kinase
LPEPPIEASNTFRFLEHPNLQLATGRASISLPVILGTALISVLTHLLGSGDLGLRESAYRVAVAALSVVPMFLVLLLAQLTRPRAVRAGVAYILLSFAIGGAARGAALAQLLELNPAIADGGSLFRVPTSLITMALSLAVLTFSWATYQSHREAISQLRLETDQLSAALARVESETQQQDLRDVSRVTAEIVAELKRIELNPAANQIEDIERLVNEQVRPLSRKHALDLESWEPSQVTPRRLSFGKTWNELNPASRFPSFWFLVPLSLTTVPAVYVEYGLVEAIEIAVFSLAALSAALYLGTKIAKLWLPKLSSPWRELAFTALLFAIVIPGVVATYLSLLSTPRPGTYVVIGLIGFPLFSWVLTLGSALLRDLENRRDELARVESELRWAIARVNLLSWYTRGVVARLLHGPIQNSLQVSLMKLQRARSIEVDDVISELSERIHQAQLISEKDSGQDPDITQLLLESEALWSEVAEASIEFDDAVTSALAKDRAAGGIVLDLCNEQFSNAIRHGGATEVHIKLSIAGPGLIKLQVDQNGSTPNNLPEPGADSPTAGLGTKFLTSCSVRFSSSEMDGRSQTEVYLPLAR